jgi:hypothetical protein
MSSAETPDLDKKKEDTSTPTTTNLKNIGGFLLLLTYYILGIIVYFQCSGLVLYACKLAQSNILPTDINCSPYTDQDPLIKEILINIFNSGDNSMKIKFPYNADNKKNWFLDMLRNYKKDPDSNFIGNYYVSVAESLMSFYNMSYNVSLNAMNQFLPETVIVLFGPLIMWGVSSLIFIAANIYAVALWVMNAGWFFKKNENANTEKPPKWVDRSVFKDALPYLFNLWLMSCFYTLGIILYIFAFPFTLLLPSLTNMFTIFSGLSYEANFNNEATPVGVGKIVMKLFKYFKVLIMALFSLMVIISAFARLGTFEGIWSIVVTGLILWGVISIDIFKSVDQTGLSPLVPDVQAMRSKCSKIKEDTGFGMMGLNLFKQSGGRKLVNELKQFGKKYRL